MLMGKYLIDKIMMGIYLNFSLKNYQFTIKNYVDKKYIATYKIFGFASFEFEYILVTLQIVFLYQLFSN